MAFIRILVFLVCAFQVRAQAPDTLWTRTYGGNYNDQVTSITRAHDSGYVIASYMNSSSSQGYESELRKLSTSGENIWERTFAGTGDDLCYSVQHASDGCFFLGGFTTSSGAGDADFWVLKVDSLGDSLWSKTIGGSAREMCYSVLPQADGGCVSAGVTYSFGGDSSNVWIVKLDSNGDSLWSNALGGNGTDVCRSVINTQDGGFFLSGYSDSYGNGGYDIAVWKTDLLGQLEWSTTVDYPGDAVCNSALQLHNSGYVILGIFDSAGVGITRIVQLSSSGAIERTRSFNGCRGKVIDNTLDGGFVIAGYVHTPGIQQSDFCLLRLDANFDSLWFRTFGSRDDQYCDALYATTDGHYLLGGWTTLNSVPYPNAWVVKTTADESLTRLVSPNGSEQLPIFYTDTILWTGVGFDGGVSIDLNRHYPIGAWERITDSTENDGAYEWFVTDPLSDSCRIRICALQDTFCDISDGNFSIVSSQGYLALVRSSQANAPLTGWNFGAVECPNAASQWFRLKNFGSESIVVFQPLEPASSEFSRNTPCGAFFALASNQMSACSLRVVFDPASDGVYSDVLRVQTDAVNGVSGFVEFALAGEQISTPAAPEVVISTVGNNAVLRWSPIVESIGHCQIDPPSYLVFFSEDPDGPFWFHGVTTDTAYTHVGAVHYTASMFYHVYAVQAEPGLLASLPRWSPDLRVSEAEIIRRFILAVGR